MVVAGARKGEASQATAAVDGLWLLLDPWGTLSPGACRDVLRLCRGVGGADLADPGLWGSGVQVQDEWALNGGR